MIAATPSPLLALLPEGALALGLLAVLVTSLLPKLRDGRAAAWIGVVAALGAFAAACQPTFGAVDTMLRIDPLAAFARAVIAGMLVMLLLAGTGEHRPGSRDADAWTVCVLGVGLGALLVAASTNVLPLWLGLELLSLGSYALAAWRGGDRRAAEAGMKYVLFGGASTGLMLFGISHLYGLTGHFDFAGIGQGLATGMTAPVVAALCLASAGIAYKLTLVPFHVYAPDVYQGAPPLSTAIVATVPKVAAGAVLLRALTLLVPPVLVAPPDLAAVLAGVAIASLVVAAATAAVQRDARRILAFSGIGHGGTAVLAMTALPGAPTDGNATAAALLQLSAYAIAALGAFVCLAVLERDTGSTDLVALRGAGRRHPWVTGALCLFLGSLVGIPPLAGFLAKWAVLDGALRGGPWPFAAALALLATTAVFAWAYLGIVRAAVLTDAAEPPAAPVARAPATVAFVLAVAAIAVVGGGLWLDALAGLARYLRTAG